MTVTKSRSVHFVAMIAARNESFKRHLDSDNQRKEIGKNNLRVGSVITEKVAVTDFSASIVS